MQYMNPLMPEDLDALNELATLTWSWNLQYWTEKTLTHGSFWINFVNPHDTTTYRVSGSTIFETANEAITKINNLTRIDVQIPDYP